MKTRPDEISRTEPVEGDRTATRVVRIVQKGRLRVAVPVEVGPVLEGSTVDAVLRKIRARRLR